MVSVKGGYASQIYWHSLKMSRCMLILLFMLECVTLDQKTEILRILTPKAV